MSISRSWVAPGWRVRCRVRVRRRRDGRGAGACSTMSGADAGADGRGGPVLGSGVAIPAQLRTSSERPPRRAVRTAPPTAHRPIGHPGDRAAGEGVVVERPTMPPELNVGAATALLRVLLKAARAQAACAGPPEAG